MSAEAPAESSEFTQGIVSDNETYGIILTDPETCPILWQILGVIFIIGFAIGFFGSIGSILIFLHPHMKGCPINILMAGLSFTDLIGSFIILPPLAPSLFCAPIQSYAKITIYSYPLFAIAYTVSIWMYTAIAFERYLAIKRPLMHRFTTHKAKWIIATIFTVGTLINLPRFWEYRLTTTNNSLQLEELLHGRPAYIYGYHYAFQIAFQYVIPNAIILVCNFSMIYSICIADRNRIQLSSSSRGRSNKDTKLTLMIGAVALKYVFCRSLLHFALLLVELLVPNIQTSPTYATVMPVLLDFGHVLYVLHYATTFIVYTVCCQRYRLVLLQLLRCETISRRLIGLQGHNSRARLLKDSSKTIGPPGARTLKTAVLLTEETELLSQV